MGFAENWTRIADAPHHPTLKDKLDTMDTIQGQTSPRGNSVHTVHIVPRGTGQAGPEASNKSVHTVHIVHKDSIREDLSMGASAPGPNQADTGLDWLPPGPDFDHPDHPGWWACFDLADLCRTHHMRVVHAGERLLILYPVELPDGLIEYAEDLLEDGKPYLRQHMDRLPILTPAGAAMIILEIMRQHKGLRFTRGDDGSRWPIYPRAWTTGQRATVQALWFAAADALDRDGFEGVDR